MGGRTAKGVAYGAGIGAIVVAACGGISTRSVHEGSGGDPAIATAGSGPASGRGGMKGGGAPAADAGGATAGAHATSAGGATSGAGGFGGSNASGPAGATASSVGTGAGTSGSTSCNFDGVPLELGASAPRGDTCNTCTCSSTGLSCGNTRCPYCSTIEDRYIEARDQARRCDPNGDGSECNQAVRGELSCFCSIWVSDATELTAIRDEWINQYCDMEVPAVFPIMCRGCPAYGAYAYCGADGKCAGSDSRPEANGGSGGAAN